MMPDCLPHETPDTEVFSDRKLWKQPKWNHALFARYTSDWDCAEETGWYWCIIDKPFDMSQLKSKYRYEIRKALENFDVKIIEPQDFTEELYDITCDAFSSYPESYRNIPKKDEFIESLRTWKRPSFGAFTKAGGGIGGLYYNGNT